MSAAINVAVSFSGVTKGVCRGGAGTAGNGAQNSDYNEHKRVCPYDSLVEWAKSSLSQ